MTTETSANKKKLIGTVLSDKAEQTIVVNVYRRFRHPKYPKFVFSTKKYHAHDAEGKAKVGDEVVITECKPYSKMKKWELLEVRS